MSPTNAIDHTIQDVVRHLLHQLKTEVGSSFGRAYKGRSLLLQVCTRLNVKENKVECEYYKTSVSTCKLKTRYEKYDTISATRQCDKAVQSED